MDAQKMLSNGWTHVRDAGEAALQYPLVPKVREWAATGAGLAVARRGGKAAITAVRRHPLLAIAGAVALAGLGLAVMAKRRREAEANEDEGADRPKRLKAKRMRGGNAGSRRSNKASPRQAAE